ncbi:MAG TPA: hypothetical protein VI864_04360 [Candidatus Bathyarchaeia archaeon]|nr:hypothetical protein [Candidatus Bathyarchaeia archaeon]
MKRKNLFAILLFFLGVLLFTRVDFLVNESLYHYGLHFNENWYAEYTSLYALCYQFLILSLLVYTRNLKLLVFMEVFVLTSTQDMVYFGLWQGAFPKIDWWWTPFYRIFGTWTTTDQALLSFFANLLVLIAISLLPLRQQRQRGSAELPRIHSLQIAC